MAIRVTADNYIRANAVEDYLAAAKQLIEKTNSLDKGCLFYDLYQDIADPLHFTMFEEWESQAALDAHLQSAHFAELIPQLAACCEKDGGPVIFKKAF